MTIQVEHEAFRAAVADVRQAAADLAEHRAQAGRRVDLLLDGGWSGAAATAFLAGWVDWCGGAEEVQAALAQLGEMLAGTHAGFVTADLGSDQTLAALATRLG